MSTYQHEVPLLMIRQRPHHRLRRHQQAPRGGRRASRIKTIEELFED